MKTYSQKPADVQRQWYILDASSETFGRVATRAASLLLGKGKPTVTPHTDGGDYVVIINAGKLRYSGNKADTKTYYRHSGFPGGLYQRTMSEQQSKDPASILHKAVRGMLPDNKLRDQRLARLKIYESEEHNHQAQQPQVIDVKRSR